MISIEYLADYREHVDTVSNWLCTEFGEENNYEFFHSIIERSLIKNKLPITFIAFDDNELVGTIGLWRSDLVSRQDLYPWLSALYVREDYRGKNIGKELQHFLIEYCKKASFSEIYLYTDLHNYYEKTGWEYLEDGVEFSGGYMKIYKKIII
ncbi:GNAT family N-acetyltransferase [Clostridium sp. 'White wine YQ']|uniref:GNAT family N-acetyltransferase n=1 Tax=Clostridium sp. 'White wine YQ' TaxID=3027474 RepID=UPI00236685B4|nr:GNAT family N-acetyltransferase [Clostridium sp. 'White wine YQ']MDD7794285.1 GNAT family N-acetyltransferase [Clostridium sp. 'White wine YQ']